ncbi:MAG: hypothetical protein HC845_12960 [Akkermansiaceae bacterium]|nr:hypothetical protein [Akkermansiaceae bacterium]
MRHYIFLAAGLAIGAVGSMLFVQSMPPEEGSAEERVIKLEAELKKASNRAMALSGNTKSRRTESISDGTKAIAERIREGKPVTTNDVLRLMQPLIRDLSPLFERIRAKELQKESDTIAGEIARKYGLNESQQASLKKWLEQRAVDESKRYTDLLSSKGTTAEDLAKMMTDVRLEDGLEQFMATTLSPDKLAAFKANQMLEKVERVQAEADMKVQRLGTMVDLDENQRGQIFGLMARGSRDFDPAMRFEGLGTSITAFSSGSSKEEAILSILRPDQISKYHDEKAKRKADAEKYIGELGLSLPENFDPLE